MVVPKSGCLIEQGQTDCDSRVTLIVKCRPRPASRSTGPLAVRSLRTRGTANQGYRMRTFDEEIARHLQEAAESGELSRAEGYGKPLPGIRDGRQRRRRFACR